MAVVYALDFDGVICDSCGESSLSAFKAAKRQWPDLFQDERWNSMPEWLSEKMFAVRPIVETGYENVLLIRLLVEEQLQSERSEIGSRPLTVGEILVNWQDIKEGLLEKYGVTKDELIELFGTTRDDWIRDDEKSWLAANRFYPGVVSAINNATKPVFIITTKQTRFAKALLDHAGLTDLPEENIFGLGSGSKVSVIKGLLARPEYKGATVHFVEDRLETLQGASLSLLGARVIYYLASWGYNTEAARQEADEDPQIELLDLGQFEAKMQ
mmetsp:Transcript_33800/g.132833  ORF Transcript_33800/g.132833 Transcript_33800/m.132833 type:complete len:270 (-) Transcript_33800:429-1238(-)